MGSKTILTMDINIPAAWISSISQASIRKMAGVSNGEIRVETDVTATDKATLPRAR